jgi:hypothetical protein
MAIGRLYYFGLSILALGFCCTSHYHMWPTKGYLPHQNIGNNKRKDPREEELQKGAKEREKQREKERKRARKERKERNINKKRKDPKPEERRRDDTPDWIADFTSKRKTGPGYTEQVPLTTPASGPGRAPAKDSGRPQRVSFEDEQPPVVSREQNGNIANGYVPYEHIYGRGPAKAGAGRTNAGYNPPPNANASAVVTRRPNGNVKSPEGRNKQRVASPPSSTNRSKHATVQSASDTISPPPVTDDYIDPAWRAFHGM